MLRDRRETFSWADVSPIATDLRQRLVLSKLGDAKDLDGPLERARPALEEVARRGGDPRFVLTVLATARWRRLRSPGQKFPRWIRDLQRLTGDEELHKLVELGVTPRGQFRPVVEAALRFLQSFPWQDVGLFDTSTTGRKRQNARWVSRRSEQALAVIAWHLKTGTTAKRTDLVLLARLAEAFNLIRSTESPPVDAVKQRLKRIKADYYQKFVIPGMRSGFHDNHRFIAWQSRDAAVKRCGTACFPNAPDDDPWEQNLVRLEPSS